MGENICEYFSTNKGDESKIYFLRGVLCCANTNCPYDNQIGKPFKCGGEGLATRFCKTNGLILEDPSLLNERAKAGDLELELQAEVAQVAQVV